MSCRNASRSAGVICSSGVQIARDDGGLLDAIGKDERSIVFDGRKTGLLQQEGDHKGS